MRVCRKEGNNNPDLWAQVLSYLVNNASAGETPKSLRKGDGSPRSPGDNDDENVSYEEEEEEEGEGGGGEGAMGEEGRWDDVREILALIERDQVLPPLRVSQATSRPSRHAAAAAAAAAAAPSLFPQRWHRAHATLFLRPPPLPAPDRAARPTPFPRRPTNRPKHCLRRGPVKTWRDPYRHCTWGWEGLWFVRLRLCTA